VAAHGVSGYLLRRVVHGDVLRTAGALLPEERAVSQVTHLPGSLLSRLQQWTSVTTSPMTFWLGRRATMAHSSKRGARFSTIG
jgi:hypothetical protein